MPTYGRQTLGTTGTDIAVSADGSPEWKHGGITLDWATVTAVGSETTLADGTIVPIGGKAIEYGTILNTITASGKYGPADTTAVDGRQTLANGKTYVLNKTVVQYPAGTLLPAGPTDHPAVIEGGRVWESRLKVGGTNQPTLAQLLAALPRLRLVRET